MTKAFTKVTESWKRSLGGSDLSVCFSREIFYFCLYRGEEEEQKQETTQKVGAETPIQFRTSTFASNSRRQKTRCRLKLVQTQMRLNLQARQEICSSITIMCFKKVITSQLPVIYTFYSVKMAQTHTQVQLILFL